jgi:hypothetical protein
MHFLNATKCIELVKVSVLLRLYSKEVHKGMRRQMRPFEGIGGGGGEMLQYKRKKGYSI